MRRQFCLFVFLLSCGGPSWGYIRGNASDPRKVAFPCETDEECRSFVEGSACLNRECRCPPDRLLSGDGSKCLQRPERFGSPCEDNVQCSDMLSHGGACLDDRCKCKRGYHYLRGLCWKSIDLDEKCYRNEQCFSAYEYSGLKCDRTCGCRDGYYKRLDSGCRMIRKVNESCNLDSDCVGRQICVNMMCADSSAVRKTTAAAHAESADTTEDAAGSLELGMDCVRDEDCSHIKNALCLNSACGCMPVKYVASEDNRNCLQVPRGKVENIAKSSCKEDAQCGVYGGSSVCENRKCACKNGTYWEREEYFCWRIKALGESCSSDRDCHPSEHHAECVGNACVCQRGYHEKNNACVPDALKVGDSCEADEECLFPNSFCDSSNACACRDHYYVQEGRCVAGVGSPCVDNVDCDHLRNTRCTPVDPSASQCLCLEDHVHSKDNRYCLPVSGYGETCEETFQCQYHLGERGECKSGICDCAEKAHYSLGRCYASKFVGEVCTKKPDCSPGDDSVICFKGSCACHYDYVLNEKRLCVKRNSGMGLKSRPILLLLLVTSSVFVFASRR